MSEAPKRIWAGKYHGTWWQSKPHHQMTEYIRADLVEAAIKRALEAAAQACEDIRQRQIMGPMPERVCFDQEQTIRALDPAQFIEEEKG
jgi:uncharacterized membrane protein YccC